MSSWRNKSAAKIKDGGIRMNARLNRSRVRFVEFSVCTTRVVLLSSCHAQLLLR
jgi:hypothetical protein